MRHFSVFFRRLLPATVVLSGLGYLPAQSPPRTVKVDCTDVLKKMRHDIAVDPGRLVLAMEDALTQNEICVCPIVRGAVDLAGREPGLVSEILIAAIHLLPAASAQITDCVLQEAPEAAPEIRATLARLLGETAPGWLPSGGLVPEASEAGNKSPVGKAPLPAPPVESAIPSQTAEEEAVSLSAVGVNGIYLIARAVTAYPEKRDQGVVIRGPATPKKQPRRTVSPVTETAPE